MRNLQSFSVSHPAFTEALARQLARGGPYPPSLDEMGSDPHTHRLVPFGQPPLAITVPTLSD